MVPIPCAGRRLPRMGEKQIIRFANMVLQRLSLVKGIGRNWSEAICKVVCVPADWKNIQVALVSVAAGINNLTSFKMQLCRFLNGAVCRG